MSRFLRHPSVLATLALALAIAVFQLWSSVSGAAKFQPVADAVGTDGRMSAEIVLTVAPEHFHIEMMQGAGRVVEIKGRSIFLADVPAERARDIARHYWVEALRPWSPRAS